MRRFKYRGDKAPAVAVTEQEVFRTMARMIAGGRKVTLGKIAVKLGLRGPWAVERQVELLETAGYVRRMLIGRGRWRLTPLGSEVYLRDCCRPYSREEWVRELLPGVDELLGAVERLVLQRARLN